MTDKPHENPQDSWGPPPERPVPQYGQYLPGSEPPRPGGHEPGGRGGRGPAAPRRRRPGSRVRSGGTPATWTIIVLCTATWGLQWVFNLVTPYSLASVLGYAPILTTVEPWRMLTSALVHAMPSPLHLLLNMYTLYLFGRMLEPLLGHWRMTVLFVLSVLGGSVGVLLLGSPTTLVIGASGGVFGLFGALFVFLRHFKRNITPIVVLIAINLVFGFVVGGIAWQAHVGGLITGAIVSLLMIPGLRNRL